MMLLATVIMSNALSCRLFKAHPEMGPLFPDVKNYQDLVEMRRKQQLEGHPERIFSALKEALRAINDADIFYAKMEAIGVLMARVGLDLQNLKVSCIFCESLL